MVSFLLYLVTLVVLLLLNANNVVAETCPHASKVQEVDAFNFELHIGLVVPNDVELSSCTPEELNVISNTLASAMSELSLRDDLHIVDLEAGSVCPEQHRRLQPPIFGNYIQFYVFRGGGRCRLCLYDYNDRRNLRGSVSSIMVDPPAKKHRRNTETGDLCGCQTLTFTRAITTEMDSTHEWLHSHGIDIRATADSIELDFVSPVILQEIALSQVYNLDVTLVDGSTANFDPNASASGVKSVTLSEGSMSSMEYCFDACKEAEAVFSAEIPDLEESTSESLTAALEEATVGCLKGLETAVAVELVPVEISNVSNAC